MAKIVIGHPTVVKLNLIAYYYLLQQIIHTIRLIILFLIFNYLCLASISNLLT